MVDIMLGVVAPIHKDQHRNGQDRQTLKKKKQDENRRNKVNRPMKTAIEDWVTLSSRHIDESTNAE